MLCSSVRLSDSIIPLSVAAIALRMAGPMTGNSASASGCGLRRTDSVMRFFDGRGEGARQMRIVPAQEHRFRQHLTDVARLPAGIVEPCPQRPQLALLRPDDERA